VSFQNIWLLLVFWRGSAYWLIVWMRSSTIGWFLLRRQPPKSSVRIALSGLNDWSFVMLIKSLPDSMALLFFLCDAIILLANNLLRFHFGRQETPVMLWLQKYIVALEAETCVIVVSTFHDRKKGTLSKCEPSFRFRRFLPRFTSAAGCWVDGRSQ